VKNISRMEKYCTIKIAIKSKKNHPLWHDAGKEVIFYKKKVRTEAKNKTRFS